MTREDFERWRDEIRVNHGGATPVAEPLLFVGSVLFELLEELREVKAIALAPIGQLVMRDTLKCAFCGCTEEQPCVADGQTACAWDQERTAALGVPICTNARCTALADQDLGRGRVIVP